MPSDKLSVLSSPAGHCPWVPASAVKFALPHRALATCLPPSRRQMLLPSMVTFLWSEMSLHQQAQKLEATGKEMEGGEKEGKKKKKHTSITIGTTIFLALVFPGQGIKGYWCYCFMWWIGVNASVAPFSWLFLSLYSWKLRTRWVPEQSEVCRGMGKDRQCICMQSGKEMFPLFLLNIANVMVWVVLLYAGIQEGEKEWFIWNEPLVVHVPSAGSLSLGCFYLACCNHTQSHWVSGAGFVQCSLTSSREPQTTPLAVLTADISNERRAQLSSGKRLLNTGEACRWVLQGMLPVFVPRLTMML